MFPNPYNFAPQTYPLGYNPWTAHAQAQFRVAQQLQQAQVAQAAASAYNVQPTLIAQSAALQQQQQQALALQNALQRNNTLIAQQTYNSRIKSLQQQQQQYYNKSKCNDSVHDLYPKTCTICNVLCNSGLQWNMHIKGKKHCKQIRGVEFQNNLTSASTTHNLSLDSDAKQQLIPSDEYVVEIDGRRKCALCHVEFTSAMCELSHIKGKRHKMAIRGHPIHYNLKKRKAPTVTLGRCELCDVDFTSITQKESHLTGKKHSKNVRLVDSGQPPKKRQKTNYFSSFKKNMNGAVSMNMTEKMLRTAVQFVPETQSDLLPHEMLQNEVERIYKDYTEIAKRNDPFKAQQIYQKYQETYDEYIREYNVFAERFKQEQITENEKEKESDNEDEKDDGLNLKKEEQETEPTITTISTVKKEYNENDDQTIDDDDH